MGKVNRKVIEEQIEKLRGQPGVGSVEQISSVVVLSLLIQLEILDALDDILQAVSGVPVERESK